MLDMQKIIKKFLIEQESNTAQLAERLGVTTSNIYAKYKRNTFYVSDLEKIAEAYGCEVEINFVPKKK